ncbi:hypothetical protein AcV7_000796 [Taiwanofungus camphoratus]|nr:hypothetical protein AcV7_000796 [Antrodia cinnamomea]
MLRASLETNEFLGSCAVSKKHSEGHMHLDIVKLSSASLPFPGQHELSRHAAYSSTPVPFATLASMRPAVALPQGFDFGASGPRTGLKGPSSRDPPARDPSPRPHLRRHLPAAPCLCTRALQLSMEFSAATRPRATWTWHAYAREACPARGIQPRGAQRSVSGVEKAAGVRKRAAGIGSVATRFSQRSPSDREGPRDEARRATRAIILSLDLQMFWPGPSTDSAQRAAPG